MTFKDRVLEIVANIPRGKTLSYKEVACCAGSPRACRAVGNIMRSNRNPSIPCHRVIRSDGTIGKFNRGIEMKRLLLKKEKEMYSQHITKRHDVK